MATWRRLIQETMNNHGDSFENVESMTLTDAQLDERFDDGFGGSEGCAFTVWTKNRVYFPIVYDGAEWCGSVSRHPNEHPAEHQGGQ